MDKQAQRIAEQADRYFVRRNNETPSQRRQREAWLAADVRHARAYEESQRTWEQLGDFVGDPSLQALKAADLAALTRPGWRRPAHLWMAAAAILLLLGVSYWAMRFVAPLPSPVRYATALGERRTEWLADGSKVVLNTESAIEVRYTRDRRDVELTQGEAQFDVVHDGRPFVVRTGLGSVTALGTRFQVRREADGDVVTLLSGKVEVERGAEQRMLKPNEQALVSASGGLTVRTVDPAQVDGWLDGWLRFSGATLSQVVAEANRYSARKLRIGDARLGSLQVSGNFRTGDGASIAAAISQILPLRVENRGTEVVLLPK